MSYVGRAPMRGASGNFIPTSTSHLHVPRSDARKAIGPYHCTALVSALTGIPVRHDVAMTGGITCVGTFFLSGGLKPLTETEINTILVPKENEKDLEEIPKSIAKEMTFHVVAHVDEVLKHALSLDNPIPSTRKLGRPLRLTLSR